MPLGCIVMWSGSLASIPSGWALCNGANGTPDLRGRFVRGAANGVDPGATGGSSTHTHAAHDDHGSLSHAGAAVANEAAHTHGYTQVPNHVHVQNVGSAATGGLSGATWDTSTNTPVASGYSTANPTGGVAAGTTQAGSSHGHAMTQPSAHAAQGHSAHDQASSEPPYFALAFIMRIA
jgi:hypothetical protein